MFELSSPETGDCPRTKPRSQAAPKPVTLKCVHLEPATVFCSRTTRISSLLAHLSQHGLLSLQQRYVLPHELDVNSALLSLLV